ncbi:hypothetical protein PV08_05276 [Exophiala spinifera]|uniref:Zn(2)-C6 fungal-type domain-containing protein n=1 Tax=Exophiala spinifera TaxID=91928 RepID=A0A0D1YJS6_9EURO|nr:uncharacterized protein PV08_05276 [Exophiala spinifera]KIW15231.1 hypothetical protein PV08_05276 [Exophiala spinifera]
MTDLWAADGAEFADEPGRTQSAKRRRKILDISDDTEALPRKRALLACDSCRSRRTKCDGQRPAQGVECKYRKVADPPPTRLQAEITGIKESLGTIESVIKARLGTIETLLLQGSAASVGSTKSTGHLRRTISHSSYQALSSPDNPFSQCSFAPVDLRPAAPHETLTFPNMILNNKAFGTFIGLDSYLATDLVALERSSCRVAQPSTRQHLFLPRQKTVEALTRFYEEIYGWFPILSVAYQHQFLTIIDGPLLSTPETCLALVIASLGSIVNREDSEGHLTFSELAFGMLSNVLAECSIVSAQCLFFIAVYYSCRCKPLEAYEYVSIASLKVQTLVRLLWPNLTLYSVIKTTKQRPRLSDVLIGPSCSWKGKSRAATVLVHRTDENGSELCIQFQLPGTGIWNFDEVTPLPSNHETWASSPDSASQLSDGSGVCMTQMHREQLLKDADAYFLAEIAMRRMLHRCTTAIRETETGELVYAPVIATELGYQLEQWHEHLPSSLKFDTVNDAEQTNTKPSVLFLRTQYFSCLLSIHWPGVYRLSQSSAWQYELHTACERFYDAYIKYLESCVPCLDRCPVNAWPLYASMFVFTMAVARTMRSPTTAASTPPNLGKCLSLASDTLGAGASSSPSLSRLHYILVGELSEHLG